ncbi:MAG: HAD-IC family P-type ATPase [Patescibacteria group bacterium]
MRFSKYTREDVREIFEEFASGYEGISDKEAEKRLSNYGPNEIKTRGTTLWNVFFGQFKSPFFYLLLAAAIIAFLVDEKINSVFILVFVSINVTLGFLQETRAEKALLLLKKYIPSKTRVLREGVEKTIDKKFLVPGDVVLLEAGDIAPADLRILKLENVLVDESVLSGESVSVPKINNSLSKGATEIFEAKNMIFAGTSLISGEVEGIVIGSGRGTILGEITKLVAEINRESAYEKNLSNLSRVILRIVLLSISLIFFANLAIKGSKNIFDFLIFCIALVVSILPEALPVVVTFALSEGSLKLAREKVVVRRLSAVEDLGDIDILCADKTGTLTENKLRLENIFSYDRKRCLLYGLLASSYIREEIESTLNPFDTALVEKADSRIKESLKKFREIDEIPFDSFRFRNSVLLEDESGNLILIVRGAPEKILELSSDYLNGGNPQEIKKSLEEEGNRGRRVLAVAFKRILKRNISEKDEKDLTFLGYFSFYDPLKETAEESINLARKLGLKIKLITGDSKEVSGYIGKEINLIKNSEKVILGEELERLSRDDFIKACESFSVFARISPRTKYKIVEALQKKCEVGFLGEGINDAPALKAANLAIAVEGAADVSREVSDIILLKKDLKVIIKGIEQGRNIFSNVNKYIKCTLASNFGNFVSIAIISLFIPFLPMLPLQILLVNLLSDFPLISIASDRVDAEELKRPKFYQLDKMIPLVVALALVSTVFDFTFFSIFRKSSETTLQTVWFIESILTEIILIFSIRTSHFFLKTKFPSPQLLLSSIFAIALTIFLPFTDFGRRVFHFNLPSLGSLLIVISLALGYFLTSEIVKLAFFRLKAKNSLGKKISRGN